MPAVFSRSIRTLHIHELEVNFRAKGPLQNRKLANNYLTLIMVLNNY